MVSCSLLTVLLVSAVSAEITCITPRRTIPDNVSCDVALGHLARYLLPCLGRETVKVGEISAISDIILPIVFVDKDDHPPGTPRCAIEVFWRGPDDQYESIPPGMLQTFATNMKNQCIAPSPHRMARGLMEPNRWIYMLTELGYQSEGFEIGNLTTPEVNGTLVPVNRPRINPTDACTGVAESFDLVNLDGSQPSVESS